MLKVRVVSKSQIIIGGKWHFYGEIVEVSQAVYDDVVRVSPDSLQIVDGQPVALREVVADVSTELPIKKKAK